MFEVDLEGRIARLSLTRGEARNAIPREGWIALSARLGEVAASEARVLLVRSAIPGSFCAGADLKGLAALAEDPLLREIFRQDMRSALDRLRDLPIPTIAAIDGGCFGAGVALAMACDMRIAGERARFTIPPARLGVSYPQADVARLAALVGPGQAARLLFGAGQIDGEEAERIGLVEQYAANGDEAADRLAAAIAANAPSSLRLLKKALAGQAADTDFDEGFAGADFTEGLAAFVERREPHFKG